MKIRQEKQKNLAMIAFPTKIWPNSAFFQYGGQTVNSTGKDNTDLFCLPLQSIRRLQLVQNSLARVVVPSTHRFHPITPVLRSLHWLAIPSRIEYKIASITFKTLHNHQPTYLHQLLIPYVPTRSLRSSDKHLLFVPSIKLAQSRQSFLHAAPTVWNSLPLALRSTSSHSLFHSLLKIRLFSP